MKIATISNNKFVICIKYLGIMEVISTFTLPNQFFVQVAKKVLTHCDLNLILIKYYEKRLEAQLKNRKTYMNEENLTESIILSLPTHLPVSSNQILTSKPLSTKLLFYPLTTPSSLLSLPSQLTPSIPFASYYNNITCPLLQLYDT